MGEIVKINKKFGSCINILDSYYEYNKGNFVIKKIFFSSINYENINEIIKGLIVEGYSHINDWKSDISLELNLVNIKSQPSNEYINFFLAQKFFSWENVYEIFDFDIAIQIGNKLMRDFYTLVEEDRETINHEYVTFTAYTTINNSLSEAQKKEIEEMDRLFGEHYKTNNWHQSDQWRNPYEYRVHVSKIEKIILTKYFKDIDSIGTERQRLRNGKTEVLELDLRNPDMAIYEKMRAIDNCIEIEWEKD
jgi:hypothetical protein